MVTKDDYIIELINIDWLLFPRQSRYGNLWRNIVKSVLAPLQARRLRKFAERNPGAVYHAVTLYYMLLCWLADLQFVGTPQGSEILRRPDESRVYKYFAIKSLMAATTITVDSDSMKKRIKELCGRDATIVQNGIDATAIAEVARGSRDRENIVSIRGFTQLYRIGEIIKARDNSTRKPRLHLIYPFSEEIYMTKTSKYLGHEDLNLGRIPKSELYKLLVSAKLVISIPISDSSPRSVYEAIFCGACVAVTYNAWIDAIPECMRARLTIVDISDESWFDKAIEFADTISREPYIPSEAALNMFDERKAMQIFVDKYY